MKLFRITREKYAEKLEASGRTNRWNMEKQYVIYASSSRSLATLELVAHRNAIMEGIKYKMVIINIPDKNNFIHTVDTKKLAIDWHLLENRYATQKYGSDWYSKRSSTVLKVPSAIIKQEFNFVINTQHPDFSEITIEGIEDFNWDKRLL
ncbi:RES domain-containing protein [Arenibacter sp. N53]|jgi:RES domain-containing protein|uniref:RES family NAD+ phosphorylase n=1 Tax=Arenibacter TaxID=178469 RepID=UPI000CD47E94|nr:MULTISPECIES: RES family NAD+ phosphorylase [Arenibacter]MCM4153578.1 RES domain-containing protein [Arenibacter sp. N53]|tara:strand:- start:69 stop:518 length:450 start_codon:yes stop_codon:yes gene_type:complete